MNAQRMVLPLSVLLLAAGRFTMAASAPTEQWLAYRTVTEARGYRWLDLSTNVPPGVALPKLNAQPHFVRWTTPLDPNGGRWMCFDRTRKSGPYNRLFIDRDGDGRLEAEPPIDTTRVDQYSAQFDPVRLVFKGEDGPLIYHLGLRFIRYTEGDSRLLVSSACAYEGRVKLGANEHRVTLVDGNVNGTFNDLASNPNDCDRIVVDGDPTGERLLGRMLEADDELYAIEVARDGAFLTVQPAQNAPRGQVRVPDSVSEFTAVGDPGHYVRKPANGLLTLPAGTYRVHAWTIERKDEDGASWKLSGMGFSDFGTFEVAVAKTAVIDVGEPVLAALSAQENKAGAMFSLQLRGRLGETVELEKGGQRPRAHQLRLASAATAFRATNSFEFG